jgi:uncharacterized Ntn-hydrolase superfamily protein
MPRRVLAFALALLMVLAPAAGATWSIVLVDTATGEIAVGSATCLESFDLEKFVPVIVVGKGGAAAQAAIDMGGTNRKKIFAELKLGTPPLTILSIIKQGDLQKASRQYGIVDLTGAKGAYTGGAVSQYKGHRVGTVGTITYSIQGNILAGAPVLDAAVMAVENSTGLLADRLMAGMVAARQMGGDGRCSCPTGGAQSCGAPPEQFLKSAHVGFAIVARLGDTDGSCSGGGCAQGEYWMDLNVPQQQWADPDPVDQLRTMYTQFNDSMAGQPDGLRSFTRLHGDQVAGDGVSTRQLKVALYDLRGGRIETGGATLSVSHAEGSAGLSSMTGFTDHGDGTYTVALQAGSGVGTDLLAVKVEGGTRPATLYPYPTLTHHAALEAPTGAISAGAETSFELDLFGPERLGGRPFLLALWLAGTVPAPGTVLLGASGILGPNGRAQAEITLPPGALLPLVGAELRAAWFPIPAAGFRSNAISLRIVP